jgi:hypothetical protein
MSFPSYNPLTNGITTGAFGVVSFNIVDPTADDGDVPAANATLFAANGKAMIVAITIIAAIVVVFVFVFVGVISTMDRMLSNDDNEEDDEFHLWIPLLESRFEIRL